jgi:hypothetical protein
MAEAPSPAVTKVGNPLKRLPTPVKLVLVGGTLGLGYSLYKSRNASMVAAVDQGSGGDTSTASDIGGGGGGGDYSYQSVPAGGTTQVPVAGPDSGETVGAVGQTALETVGNIATGFQSSLTEIVTSRPDPPPPDWEGLAAFFSAAQPPAQPAPTARQVTNTSTQATNAPTKHVDSVTILNHKFNGGVSYRELQGTKDHRSFLIEFQNGHHEGWYYYTTKTGKHKAGEWQKVSG